MPNTKKDARECGRLWGRGEIISEIHGDDPGMPRRKKPRRKALARPLGLRGRKSTRRDRKEPTR